MGRIKRRSPHSWMFSLEAGYVTDPNTGRRKRKQQVITVRGTRRQAEARRAELIYAKNRGEFVEPSKLTLGQWLTEWLEKVIKPPKKRASTYEGYARIIANDLRPAIGDLRLQQLTQLDLERYYATKALSLSPATLMKHHAIVSGALKGALRAGLVTRNVATLVEGKPKASIDHERIRQHCWELNEAQGFLAAATAAGPQLAALFALALDSGARKGELCGLRWSDLDLDKSSVRFMQQLTSRGRTPTFGPVKNGVPRTVALMPETVALLRDHKRHQAALKMANRTIYHDYGLVFAKEWGHLHGRQDSLGLPLQSNNLGQREFARVIKAANVRAIKFHGLRHTSATLLLKAGEHIHVVSRRLGHKNIQITLDTYAHVLPSMQQDAAQRLSDLLYRSGAAESVISS